MAIVDVTIVPLGSGSSVSRYVAKTHKVLEASGLKHVLCPMGTVIEGDLDEILKVIRQMHESVFEEDGVVRVSTSIKIDDRRDREASIEKKLASVQEKLK